MKARNTNESVEHALLTRHELRCSGTSNKLQGGRKDEGDQGAARVWSNLQSIYTEPAGSVCSEIVTILITPQKGI